MTIHRAAGSANQRKADRVIDLMVFAVAGEIARAGLDRAVADHHARLAVKAVCQMVGGDEIYLPKLTQTPRTETAAELLQLWREGEKIDDIAFQRGFSARWVRILIGEARAVNRTHDMAQGAQLGHAGEPA